MGKEDKFSDKYDEIRRELNEQEKTKPLGKYEKIKSEEDDILRDDVNIKKILLVFAVFCAAMVAPFVLYRTGVITQLICDIVWGCVVIAMIITYITFKRRRA